MDTTGAAGLESRFASEVGCYAVPLLWQDVPSAWRRSPTFIYQPRLRQKAEVKERQEHALRLDRLAVESSRSVGR